MPISGTVQVTGPIAPTDASDTYPSHFALYGKGGHRSVADLTARNAISTARRVEGMLVYTESDEQTWRLLPAPWVGTNADWVEFDGGDPAVGGDLSGTVSNATVAAVQGVSVAATAPSGGDSFIFNAAANEWQPSATVRYYVSSAAAVLAAPHINGTLVVIYPGSPTSEAGTYQVSANGGVSFPADYTKLSDITDTASEVGIVDSGNYYTSTNVEGALQELGPLLLLSTTGALAVAVNVMDTVAASSCEGGDWEVLVENGVLRYKTLLSVTHNGTSATATESAVAVGPGVTVLPITFDADISGANLRILATATSAGWSYRARRLTLLAI